jgi:hypothetical protein
MKPSIRIVANFFLALGAAIALGTPAAALECGDLNADCTVSTTDALLLLRRSVGLNAPMFCECGSICTGSVDDLRSADECFADEGCDNPEKPYCDDFVCAECSKDEHCGVDESCDHALHQCMRNCAYF